MAKQHAIKEEPVREDTNKNAKVLPNFEPYNGRDPYIFVSYAHSDNDVVNGLMNTLVQDKFRLWYDAGLEVGNDFREELAERIQHCAAMIFFASERSLASKYCAMEIISAVKYNKRIFPFFLAASGTLGIPVAVGDGSRELTPHLLP